MQVSSVFEMSKRELGLFSIVIFLISIAALTISLYWQVQNFEFVFFDDNIYVFNNKNLQKGFSFEGLKWAFTSFYAANWHPLTWMSHMLDFQLFYLKAGGHHWTSVILHILNVFLVFFVFYRLSSDLWKSSFISAIFALHPLHVESVAWVSERKDLLCAFFWFLTIFVYNEYVKENKLNYYLLALIFFILGLLSKPMIVTLPFALILLDFWPLKRFQKQERNPNSLFSGTKLLILEKTPFFLLSFIGCVVTLYAQHYGGAVAPLDTYPLAARIVNAVKAYGLYCVKTFWPENLAFYYPYLINVPLKEFILWSLFLLFVSILAFKTRGKYPYFLFGWLWFLGTLLPVIGLVQVGAQSMADRYTYIPMIGLLVIVAWGLPDLISQKIWRDRFLPTAAAVVICCYTAISWKQISYWQNSQTLFEHALRVTRNNAVTHNNFGVYLASQGKYDLAMKHHKDALRLSPRYIDAIYNVGNIHAYKGEFDSSVIYYKKVISYKSHHYGAHYNLALVLAHQGKVNEAIAHLRIAKQIVPDDRNVALALGNLLLEKGRFIEAVSPLSSALASNPTDSKLNNDMGVALAGLKRYAEAEKYFRRALTYDPNFVDAKNNLALAMRDQGKLIRQR